jgi:hypothetical protein
MAVGTEPVGAGTEFEDALLATGPVLCPVAAASRARMVARSGWSAILPGSRTAQEPNKCAYLPGRTSCTETLDIKERVKSKEETR